MTTASPVRDYLRTGAAARPPIIGTLFYQAARLEGVEMSDLLDDATRLTRVLLNAQQLFRGDVVTVRLETALAAAAGVFTDWSGPGGTPGLAFAEGDTADPKATLAAAGPLIDSIGRLTAELRRRLPVVAVLPGPIALLGGRAVPAEEEDRAAAVVRAVAEAACKAGASIVLMEEGPGAAADPRFARLAGPAVNTARYYAATVIVGSDPAPPKSLADGVLLPAPPPEWPAGQRVGLRVPAAMFGGEDAPPLPTGRGPFFLAVDDEALGDLPVEAIAEGFERLRTITFG